MDVLIFIIVACVACFAGILFNNVVTDIIFLVCAIGTLVMIYCWFLEYLA